MANNNLDSDREKIAARLKEARTLAGLSQEQAATILKIQRPAISEIESGKEKLPLRNNPVCCPLQSRYNWLLLQDDDDDERVRKLKVCRRELGKLSQLILKRCCSF